MLKQLSTTRPSLLTFPLLKALLLYFMLGSAYASSGQAPESVQLPGWRVLQFEEKAFWATARSRLEVDVDPEDPQLWLLSVQSSVVDNSENILIRLDPATGRALSRERVSRGKEQRMKSWQYEVDFILRERRDPEGESSAPAKEWPLAYSGEIPYPDTARQLTVTTPYLLLLLAQQLQDQGAGQSLNVLVHTDLNFYRAHLTSGNGIPITVDYTLDGEKISGRRETQAVAIQVSPEGDLAEESDFSFLGLQGEVILFFDRDTGVPLQVRGQAPRIGTTEINLKSATMRKAP